MNDTRDETTQGSAQHRTRPASAQVIILPQLTNSYLWGKPTPRKKTRSRRTHTSWAPRLSVRAPRAVDLEVALLAERRARGRDGQRMRFAASSSVDLGQHAGAAFASDGGRRCEVRRRAARPVDELIAGNPARRASCAARRQLERGRAGERRAHRRLAGQAGLLRRLAGQAGLQQQLKLLLQQQLCCTL